MYLIYLTNSQDLNGRWRITCLFNVEAYLLPMGIIQRIQFRGPEATALKVAGLNVCRVKYTPSHHPLPLAGAILKDRQHVLYLPTRKRWESRSKDTLWWNVNSNTLSLKRTVRSWCSRRMRTALVEALKSYGFDANGRLLGGGPDGPKPGLRGTMAIAALPCLATTKFPEVQTQAGLLVQALKRRMKEKAKSPLQFSC